MATISPFARPLYVMLKPVGAHCNLACDYCYYLEKLNLYQDASRHVMSDELLEKFIKEYIESQTMPDVLFTWHGGETLMRPLAFYKKAIELQQKYARGRRIDNCIQTNGTMLNDEWCKFFHDNQWLVGVSIDGPKEFHDEYRRNRQGQPSFVKVMKGIDLLNKYQVEWNAMAVVNDFNADYPLDFYHFFKKIGCHYIQFTPIVERIVHHADGRRFIKAGISANQLLLLRCRVQSCLDNEPVKVLSRREYRDFKRIRKRRKFFHFLQTQFQNHNIQRFLYPFKETVRIFRDVARAVGEIFKQMGTRQDIRTH